jgi:hypothetical protein
MLVRHSDDDAAIDQWENEGGSCAQLKNAGFSKSKCLR